MTENQWRAANARAFQCAERELLEAGEVTPIFLVKAAGKMHAIGAAWHNSEEKDFACSVVRACCAALDADGYTMVTEAWMTMIARRHAETRTEHHARATSISPSKREDRIEVVIVASAYFDQDGHRQTFTEWREISRDASGKATGLLPQPAFLEDDDGSVRDRGRFLDILPEDRRAYTPKVRAAAEQLLRRIGDRYLERTRT